MAGGVALWRDPFDNVGSMSRKMTIAWVDRNCPDRRIVRDVAARFDEAERVGGQPVFLIGRALTRPGKPYLLASLDRDMFVFALSEEQAANLGVEPNAVGSRVRRSVGPRPAADPPVTLRRVIIEHADSLDADAPVVGSFDYESSAGTLEGMTLRMVYDLPDRSTISHYDHFNGLLLGRGTLRFRMSPLAGPKGEPPRALPRTLLVIFNLCRCVPAGQTPDEPISDTVATLVDLA